MVIEITGKILFDPIHVSKKHGRQSVWKKTAMIVTGCDMHAYYAWFLRKRFNLVLMPPLRGTHVTFINEEVKDEVWTEARNFFNGKEATFFMEIEPRSNSYHWWFRTHSPDTESIRESMGLSKSPFFTLHMTIGSPNEKNINHSRYILEKCKEFELISNEPRKPLDHHEIIKFS